MATQMLDDQTFSPQAIQAAGGTKTGTDRMSIQGVTVKSLILLAIMLVAAGAGWHWAPQVFETVNGLWFLVGYIILIALTIWAAHNPKIAAIVGSIYGICQGIYLGALSRMYNTIWHGVVTQTVMATICVFAVCMILYNMDVVRVSSRMRKAVIVATIGIAVLYLVAWILSLFDIDIYFWNHPSAIGIIVSVLFALVASLNLFLNFDQIEKGINAGAPKSMEWYSAFGLLATLVWVYVQSLQLISLLREDG